MKYRVVLGSGHWWVFLPGWALDSRVFGYMKTEASCLYLDQLCLPEDVVSLRSLFESYNISSYSIMGLSLGGYQALSLCHEYEFAPQQLCLMGLRDRYSAATIRLIKRKLERDGMGYLSSFYRSCFSNGGHGVELFSSFLDRPIKDLDLLNNGLMYLLNAHDSLRVLDVPVLLCHGGADQVAPVAKARQLSTRLSWPIHLFSNGAHVLESLHLDGLKLGG